MSVEATADEVEYRGQVYRRVGRQPYVRKRDGTATTLSVWLTNCPTCGAEFEATTGDEVQAFHPARHCPAHRRQGSRSWRNRVAVTDPATIAPVTWPQREFVPVEAYDDLVRK
ncbi:hypothetical protein ACWGS9_19930 [Bradyrhizobium sp. Arg314]